MVNAETRCVGVVLVGVLAAILGAPPPSTADLLAAELRSTAVDEVVAARSAHTARFRVRHRPGVFAEVASGRPLHVRDTAGRWRPSRGGLAARGGDWVAEHLPQRIEVRPQGIAVAARDGSGGLVF